MDQVKIDLHTMIDQSAKLLDNIAQVASSIQIDQHFQTAIQNILGSPSSEKMSKMQNHVLTLHQQARASVKEHYDIYTQFAEEITARIHEMQLQAQVLDYIEKSSEELTRAMNLQMEQLQEQKGDAFQRLTEMTKNKFIGYLQEDLMGEQDRSSEREMIRGIFLQRKISNLKEALAKNKEEHKQLKESMENEEEEVVDRIIILMYAISQCKGLSTIIEGKKWKQVSSGKVRYKKKSSNI